VDPDERDRALGRSRKGREVLRLLEEIGRPATAAEIRSRTGAGPAVLRSLAASGLLLTFEQAPAAEPGPAPAAVFPRHRLSAGQEAALATLVPAIREKRFLAALLFGVTGSGKTEVYLRAMESALEAGRGAIWLVPEIALTPVFARRLRRQFGGLATVFHSGLSERERAEAWERLRDGRSRIVIGPRSAAFAPMPDPGLFVVDEEHDTSYKQRESPRYDARDVVALRARASGAAVVYGSATPSIEIQEAARRGRVERLVLPERIDARPLPQVSIVDLRHEPWIDEEKGIPLFSRPLLSRLTEVFARGEQAILLQPRRGFAPVLLCRSCGHDFRCPRCSVALGPSARPCPALPLLRPAGSAAGALPGVRRRAARGRRGRHRARRGALRRPLPGDPLRGARPRHGAPPRHRRDHRRRPGGARPLPDRHADGRQGP
jgi:primosomal protein N' (replication factor Y)